MNKGHLLTLCLVAVIGFSSCSCSENLQQEENTESSENYGTKSGEDDLFRKSELNTNANMRIRCENIENSFN